MKLSKIARAIAYPLMAVALVTSVGLQAYDKGDWVVRAGATIVAPDEDSSNVNVGGADLGMGVAVDNSTQLGLNIAYFFAPKWSVEVLAATPFSHDIELADVKIINAKQLPPSVTANYFFNNTGNTFQPYVGAGLNYTLFFDESFAQSSQDAGFSDIDLDASFGVTVQAGFDYMLKDNWLVNASVRWIDIDTDATFDLNGAAGEVSVDIDPFVYTVSVGYRF